MATAAWTARIDSVAEAGDFEHVLVGVSYFDALDTGFATVLWQHTFEFEFTASQADVAAAIRKLGQEARGVQAVVAGLQPQVGTTIAVP